MFVSLALFFTFLVSVVVTGMTRKFALDKGMVDVPNHRSAHTQPTPRGGGLSIAIVCLVAIFVLGITDRLSMRIALALMSGGVLVSAIGLLDDRAHIPVHWRLSVHAGSAMLLLIALYNSYGQQLSNWPTPLGVMNVLFCIVAVIWSINLYNFMDGIDSIASVQALLAFLPAGILMLTAGEWSLAMVCFVYAVSVAGFLVWNTPPARIFMGDVGSGFLGFSVASIALISHLQGTVSVWVWLILLGVFIVDSSVTLIIRILSGQRWFEAHNVHAYQHAARIFKGHAPVVIAMILINLFWLLPMAAVAYIFPNWEIVIMLIAWVPLICLAIYFRAGILLH